MVPPAAIWRVKGWQARYRASSSALPSRRASATRASSKDALSAATAADIEPKSSEAANAAASDALCMSPQGCFRQITDAPHPRARLGKAAQSQYRSWYSHATGGLPHPTLKPPHSGFLNATPGSTPTKAMRFRRTSFLAAEIAADASPVWRLGGPA